MPRLVFTILVLLLPTIASAELRFPSPEFESGYKMPDIHVSQAPKPHMAFVDVGVFVAALGAGVWLIYYKRSRRGVFWLTLFSLAYFGFYREGCVCSVGSIGNVALAAGTGYSLPWLVAVFFALPLILALFYGRVFCAGVCPLGMIQDVVVWKPVQVPNWLEQSLGLFAHLYLGLAVVFAFIGSDFIICRYDPFVGFFRFGGKTHMLVIGGVILLLSMFVGRTYCRFICPYSVLLRWLSPLAMRRVTITPDKCIDCRLCETSCPYGAIRRPTPPGRVVPTPKDRRRLGWILVVTPVLMVGFALLGRSMAPILAETDRIVKLSRLVAVAEKTQANEVPDEVRHWRSLDQKPAALYAQAATLRGKFMTATTIYGAYVGLVIGLRLVVNAIRRRREGYTTDTSACVACARCYSYCPVELGKPLPVLPLAQVAGQPQPAAAVA